MVLMPPSIPRLDAVTTQGTILANSAGQGTLNSARQVFQDKIGKLASDLADPTLDNRFESDTTITTGCLSRHSGQDRWNQQWSG